MTKALCEIGAFKWKPYTRMYINHGDILNGGTLEFVMSTSPDKKRGLAKSDKPYSLTDGE